ncbi:hypothetical protein [Glutamicibacter sp.]|uniref:hypothetical protein n=1 Tax=Glutamicibacter sp. TaxID=1931995 RepID=UPI002B45E0B4|nr:hypothetical protein [Glutamicibacter sp.]HJX77699.1 hypothetical protein [Glutamicibacter sp.]
MKELKSDGFTGFRPIKTLEINRVPNRQGLFVILRPADYTPKFLTKSTAGIFKKKDPSLPVADLSKRWVDSAQILYLGKAGPGSQGNRGLRIQLKEIIDFGAGKPPGHWDSRLLWQLGGVGKLMIAWKELPAEELNAALVEYQARFIKEHGQLPYANLVQSRR